MRRKKKTSLSNVTVTVGSGDTAVTTSGDKLMARLQKIEEGQQEKKQIEIKSALIKNGMFCSYNYDENLPSNVVRSQSVPDTNIPVHPDLLLAFKKLNVHLALICEEIKPEEISDVDNIADYDDK